jgi:hypothetical protein
MKSIIRKEELGIDPITFDPTVIEVTNYLPKQYATKGNAEEYQGRDVNRSK